MDVQRVSLLPVVNMLLGRWRMVLGFPVAAAIVGIALGLALGKEYHVRSRFAPQTQQGNAGQFAGLAAQFGVSLGNVGSGATESPDFYADLLKTRDLLKQAVLSTYRVPRGSADTAAGTLLDLWDVSGGTPEARTDRAVERLLRVMTVSVSLKTGVVALEIQDRSGALALALNQRLLDLLNTFNLERRQSQAAAERRFVEGRLADARQSLNDAEQRLAEFLERNRRYQDSPELTFEAARLQRQVDLQQQIYTSLAQSYEKARIDEVRNTPVITIVDPPDVLPGGRGLTRKALVGFLLGGVLGIVLAVGREYWDREKERHPGDVSLLRSRLSDIRGALLRRGAGAPGQSAR